MRHASLFTGIGGFDYAASKLGWENIFQVEIDPYCTELLALRFPNAKRYHDIKQFLGKEYYGKIDIISGGFPCQPFSVAGKQQGKGDDRYLWNEMLRVITEIRPTWIVGENVTGIIKLALDEVLLDLENIGYTTETFIIPACAVNAVHRRNRVWIVAHSSSQRTGSESREIGNKRWDSSENRRESIRQGYGETGTSGINSTSWDATYSNEYSKPNLAEHDRTVELSQNPGCKNGSRSNEQGETPKADRTETTNESEFSISRNTQRITSHTTGKRCNNGCNNGKKRQIQDDKGITKENQSEWSRWECRIGEISKSSSHTTEQRLPNRGIETLEGSGQEQESERCNGFHCNSNGNGLQRIRTEFNNEGSIRLSGRENSGWRALEWPTEPPLCGTDDGISRRVDRLKGLGNSVVPQLVYEIFKCIDIIDKGEHNGI